ncbi:MAG TPA: hypothetical protein VEZ72_05220 [Paenibacillus sp.]|nr:hypothetical protein [Paenibacillus sp.]
MTKRRKRRREDGSYGWFDFFADASDLIFLLFRGLFRLLAKLFD